MAEAEDEEAEEAEEGAVVSDAAVSDAFCATTRSGSPRDLAAPPWR